MFLELWAVLVLCGLSIIGLLTLGFSVYCWYEYKSAEWADRRFDRKLANYLIATVFNHKYDSWTRVGTSIKFITYTLPPNLPDVIKTPFGEFECFIEPNPLNKSEHFEDSRLWAVYVKTYKYNTGKGTK